MADYDSDDDKKKFVVAFGESDGGHSFVTLSDAIDPDAIKSVQPQDDVWGAIEMLRNGAAQIAVVPFSNKITSAEAATLAGLASGELKVIGQITRKTNHVLVGLKDYVRLVGEKFGGSYANERDYETLEKGDNAPSQHSNLESRKAEGKDEPPNSAIAKFVFLLRMVYSSKTVFDQTRGKLTGSDFRNNIKVEHTSNPMRVLLRYYRDRETDAVVNKIEKTFKPPSTEIRIGEDKDVGAQRPLEDSFFSAALVAEGLLDSAKRVCQIGPGLTPNQLCSQRLSEITSTLRELKTDAVAPLDLPNNETTFLVLQAGHAKLSDEFKKNFPWESGESKKRQEVERLEADIAYVTGIIKSHEKGVEEAEEAKAAASSPAKRREFDLQIQRVSAEIERLKAREKKLRAAEKEYEGRRFGPLEAERSYRAAFALASDNPHADWSRIFKVFNEKMGKAHPGLKLKFDQSPEMANYLGKNVQIVTARVLGIGNETADGAAAALGKYLKKEKERASKDGGAYMGGKPEDAETKFEGKLLGVYPSWIASGANRSNWYAEGQDGPVKSSDAGWTWPWIVLFAAFWLIVIFVVLVTATETGQAILSEIWNNPIGFLSSLIAPTPEP